MPPDVAREASSVKHLTSTRAVVMEVSHVKGTPSAPSPRESRDETSPEEHLITSLQKFLHDPDTLKDYRMESGDFHHARIFTFPVTVVGIAKKRAIATTDVLQELFDELNGNEETGSDGAFRAARAKVSPDIFLALNERIRDACYREFEDQGLCFRWNGYLVVAIDGTTIVIPDNDELAFAFPMPDNQPHPKNRRLALASFQVDVLNNVIWTADLVPIQYERDLVADVHVQYRRPDAIYLYDRLYCSYEFIAWHVQRQEHFVIRCPLKSTFRLVEEFADDPTRDDELVTLSVPHERRAVIRERELPKDVTVRLVKITLPSGGVEVLMTSLVDDEAFPREAIRELYAMRWGAETSINYLKTVIDGNGELEWSDASRDPSRFLQHGIPLQLGQRAFSTREPRVSS